MDKSEPRVSLLEKGITNKEETLERTPWCLVRKQKYQYELLVYNTCQKG